MKLKPILLVALLVISMVSVIASSYAQPIPQISKSTLRVAGLYLLKGSIANVLTPTGSQNGSSRGSGSCA